LVWFLEPDAMELPLVEENVVFGVGIGVLAWGFLSFGEMGSVRKSFL